MQIYNLEYPKISLYRMTMNFINHSKWSQLFPLPEKKENIIQLHNLYNAFKVNNMSAWQLI